jgi:hypothetical protein
MEMTSPIELFKEFRELFETYLPGEWWIYGIMALALIILIRLALPIIKEIFQFVLDILGMITEFVDKRAERKLKYKQENKMPNKRNL